MPRIQCRQPSAGRPLTLAINSVGTAWVTLAEAPDFSVFDPSAALYPTRDPLDVEFGLAAGELFLIRPLLARNLTVSTRWIEAQFLSEAGVANTALGRIAVPAGETVVLVTQGLSLVKRIFAGVNGDRLQVRAEASASFAAICAGEERLAAEHVAV